MALIRSHGTKAELFVRRIVRSLGFGYRLNSRLPGKPDLAFPGRKKVIFVHGCFWHRHDDQGCRLSRLPKSRLEFWIPKLAGNQMRDQKAVESLLALGFEPLVVWECELKDEAALRARVREFLQ